MRRIGRWAGAGITGTVASVALMTASHAAVRQCQPMVNSGIKEAATEVEAKKSAMSAWILAAGQAGPGYSRWELADKRRLACVKSAAGTFQCVAVGLPCMITQAPGRPAPKTIPQKRKSQTVDA